MAHRQNRPKSRTTRPANCDDRVIRAESLRLADLAGPVEPRTIKFGLIVNTVGCLSSAAAPASFSTSWAPDFADLRGIEADRRQRRRHVPRGEHVVEADQAHVAGNRHADLPQAMDEQRRFEIAIANGRRRPVVAADQRVDRVSFGHADSSRVVRPASSIAAR